MITLDQEVKTSCKAACRCVRIWYMNVFVCIQMHNLYVSMHVCTYVYPIIASRLAILSLLIRPGKDYETPCMKKGQTSLKNVTLHDVIR